jgi:bis(5'-nucleosyl)-tetraphosphatase (symmetrical)
MVHAGVLPQWGLAQTIYWARTLEKYLLQNHLKAGLRSLWGDSQENWHEDLTIKQKLRLAINALTRIRFCYHDGRLDFTNKGKLTTPGTQAWFDLPTRKTRDTLIAFGHWSQLGYINQPKLIALDTGCVWGGHLSALRFGQDFQERELIQVQCDNTVI